MPTATSINLGSVFTLGKYQVRDEEPWSIVWLIAEMNEKYLYCISYYILDLRCFDAAEPKNPDPNRREFGNNHYLVSNIRQWLNSDAAPGEWYQPTHEFDAAPEYVDRPGFLFHWSEEEKSLLQDMELNILPNQVDGREPYLVTDRVWLPTIDQLAYAADIFNNFHFDYFDLRKKRSVKIHPKTYKMMNNPPCGANDSWLYWTASPDIYPAYSHSVLDVLPSGVLLGDGAYDGRVGVRPCIKLSLANIGRPDDPAVSMFDSENMLNKLNATLKSLDRHANITINISGDLNIHI